MALNLVAMGQEFGPENIQSLPSQLSDIGAATLSRAQLGAEASGSTDRRAQGDGTFNRHSSLHIPSSQRLPCACRVRTRAEGVEVKVCAKCEGTGQFVEIYGFRRLESTCADCCGRGCITYRHGVPVDDSGPGSDAAAPVDSAALAEQRKAKARRCAESCRAKITAYTAEREGALARMAATTDERERSLCADLLGQLEKAMADKQEQLVSPSSSRLRRCFAQSQ